MIWHQQDVKRGPRRAGCSIDGLRSEEAGHRLAEFGRNELKEKGRRSPIAMFVDQFRDFMILVLVAPPWSPGSWARRPTPSPSS
jgi:Ca2+-transporting ATPase